MQRMTCLGVLSRGMVVSVAQAELISSRERVKTREEKLPVGAIELMIKMIRIR